MRSARTLQINGLFSYYKIHLISALSRDGVPLIEIHSAYTKTHKRLSSMWLCWWLTEYICMNTKWNKSTSIKWSWICRLWALRLNPLLTSHKHENWGPPSHMTDHTHVEELRHIFRDYFPIASVAQTELEETSTRPTAPIILSPLRLCNHSATNIDSVSIGLWILVTILKDMGENFQMIDDRIKETRISEPLWSATISNKTKRK